jgi:hypothetical protein
MRELDIKEVLLWCAEVAVEELVSPEATGTLSERQLKAVADGLAYKMMLKLAVKQVIKITPRLEALKGGKP